MKNYLNHLGQMYNKRTFIRKMDYLNYNFSKIFKDIGSKNISVLEIGPGMGECISFLNSKGIDKIDIVDNDKHVLDNAKKNYKIQKSILSNDVTLIDEKLGKYNLIVIIQVLEHIPVDRYKKTIQILYKHLAKGGYIVIVVPNANNPLGLIERYGDLQHQISFTEQSLKDLVNVSSIGDFELRIEGYKIPPYDIINIIRIIFQKTLHLFLYLLLIINGGIYFKTMTPNISLIIKKKS